jgi:hypothetical protein
VGEPGQVLSNERVVVAAEESSLLLVERATLMKKKSKIRIKAFILLGTVGRSGWGSVSAR